MPTLLHGFRLELANACRKIDCGAIASAAGLSRRALDKKFHDYIGRTPMQEVNAIRLRNIKQLLVETDLILPEVAERNASRIMNTCRVF